MVLIVCNDGNATHTGSTVVGPVVGTLIEGSNTFVNINGVLICVEDMSMVIPTHQYVILPPAFHNHTFSPNNFQQEFVTVEGKKITLKNDYYSSDMTTITNEGSNTFVNIG